MTLVERFIEFNGWSTSRKTALLAGLGLPSHVIAWLLMRSVFSGGLNVNMILLDQVMAGGAVAMALCFAAGLITARAGQEGRWTAYAVVLSYGFFIVCLIYALGTWSTTAFSTYPLVVIVVLLWFGETIGWLAFIYGLLLATGARILEANGAMPYAPALLERTIDGHNTAAWVIGNSFLVYAYFVFCFVFCVLIVAALRLKDTRLQEALQKLDRSAQLISRYVPVQIATAIMSGQGEGEGESVDAHTRRKLTLFFSDLVGFTDIAEQLEPEDLSRVLNEYFSAMTAVAQHYDGTVDELSGDAILIFFGAPQATSDADHALRAVRMAMEMQQAVEALNAKWHAAGI
ncbi:MAG: adenylate/guanylate cyclase domain-containing protein, partial [Solimonas sp.]